MSSETHELIAVVKAKTMNALRKINDFTKGIVKSTKEMGAFQQAGATAAGMLMRDMVQGSTAALGESIRLGASLETLSNSFMALTRAQGVEDASLGDLRNAVQGTIADVDLLTAANTALGFKIPYEQFMKYSEAAVIVGRSIGMNATKSVNDFSVALGRLSPKILDNFAIQLQLSEASEIYARRLGKTVDALTESERRIAFQTVATEMLTQKAAILSGTTSEAQLAQEKFSASMKNLTTAVGSVLTPLGALTPVLQSAMPLFGTFAGVLIPNLIGKYGALGLATKAWAVATAWASKLVTVSILGIPIIGWIAAATLAITGIVYVFQKWGQASDELKQAQGELTEAQRAQTETARAQDAALADLEMATTSLVAAQEAEQDALDDLEEKTAALERAQHNMGATLAWVRDEVASVDLVTEELTWTSGEAKQRFDALGAELQELRGEFQATSAIAKGFRDQLSDLSLAQSKLRLEQLKLRDALEDGELSQKAFEQANEELESQLRDLEIEQAELRIQLTETEDALDDQADSIDDVEAKANALAKADDALEKATDDVADAMDAVAERQAATATAMTELAEKERLAEEAAKDLKKALDALESKTIEIEVIEKRRYEEELEKERLEAQYGLPSLEQDEYGHQHGFDSVVEKPTWFLAGEAGPEHVSITPGRSAGGGISIQGPLIQVLGSADLATAEYAVRMMRTELRNVLVEASSSGAPATHKRIRFGSQMT